MNSKVGGNWQGNEYRIRIRRLFNKDQASVRDDTLKRIIQRKGTLVILSEKEEILLQLPHDQIEKNILWKQGPKESKYGIPYFYCYFSVKGKG